jgi:hemerythrin-like domain-containing protein
MLRYIRSAQGDDDDARRHVKDLGISYCADHSSHIRSEETDVFPQAAKWLTAADWREVGKRSQAMTDPEFERNELKRYDNLYDRLMSMKRDPDTR